MVLKTDKASGPVPGLSRTILIAGVSLILIACGFCGYRVHSLSGRQEQMKTDYSVVNSVSFGLLSVNRWRDEIIAAVTYQIRHFRLNQPQQDSLKKEIEVILHGLVNKAVRLMDKPKKSIGGKLKKLAFDALVNEKKLQQQVPAFSDKIMAEINKPSSYRRLQDVAETELAQLGKQTYDSSLNAEKALLDSIFAKYHASDEASFEKKNAVDQSTVVKHTYFYASGMLACILLILGLWWLLRNNRPLHTPLYILSVISAVILLVVGLTTTMIEVDARIQSLDFHLLGENISFKNQVLFFQSKSIVDVVKLLLKTGRVDSEIVGLLILCFSILFPVSKLLSAGIFLLSERKWAKNKVIYYFAFESGKWSMADVMVVAILMTYLAFNGIVESELAGLNVNNGVIASITTNNTSFEPGYIVFIGFVIYGLVLSTILKKIVHH